MATVAGLPSFTFLSSQPVSDALQPVTPAVTLVTDREQSVYAEWSRTYRENRMPHERVGELEAAARAERVCVAEAPAQPAGGAPEPDTHPTAETAPPHKCTQLVTATLAKEMIRTTVTRPASSANPTAQGQRIAPARS